METFFDLLPIEIITEIILYLKEFNDLKSISYIFPFTEVLKDLSSLLMKACRKLNYRLFQQISLTELLESTGYVIYKQKRSLILYADIANYIRIINNIKFLLDYIVDFEYKLSEKDRTLLLIHIWTIDDDAHLGRRINDYENDF